MSTLTNGIAAVVENITPSKAKAILESNKKNRPVSERNLNQLVSELNKGNFHLTGESIKISKAGNLLDGQHRLLAIVKTGRTENMLVVRGLEEDSFKYIDTGKSRTPADVLGIEGFKYPTRLASIARFIMSFKKGHFTGGAKVGKGRKTTITNAEISDFVNKNFVSINDSMPFGYNRDNKLVKPNTLASLHYVFKGINTNDANDFCWKVSIGEGVVKDSPIYLLRQALTSDLRSTKKMSVIQRNAIICKAWNYFRQGKKISQLKWDSIREPFPKPI